MQAELSIDQRLEVINSDIKKVFERWKMEFETRDGDKKADYEYQVRLSELLDGVDWNKCRLMITFIDDIEDKVGGFGEWFSLIKDSAKGVDHNYKHVAVVDGLRKTEFHGRGELEMSIFGEKTGFHLIPEEKGAGRLPFLPNEIHGIEVVTLDKKDRMLREFETHRRVRPYKDGKEQNIGYVIDSYGGMLAAWKKAVSLGEVLAVKLDDGRVCTVEKFTNNIIEPSVHYSWDDERDKHHEAVDSIWSFIKLGPVVL